MVKITQMKKTTLRQAALRLAIVALAVLAPLGLRAQSPLTIGTGTSYSSTSDGLGSPMGRAYYYNSSAQFIYTAEELASMGGAKAITSVAFYHNAYSFSNNIKIYLAHTTATTVDATAPVTNPTLVYSGDAVTIGGSSEGWQIFEFDDPFNYNGTDNLLVVVCRVNNSTGYSSSQTWQYTETSDNKYMVRHSDTQAYGDVTNTSYSYTVSTKRPNIQIAYTNPITCTKPSGLVVSLTPGNGTIATLNWTENGTATNWELQYGTLSDFSDATTKKPKTNPTFNLKSLTPETPYYARVRAKCSDTDLSDWSAPITFTPTNALTVTVCDGAATNSNAPIRSGSGSQSEFVYPASMLTALDGQTLVRVKFYASTTTASYTNNVTVYMQEVSGTTESTSAWLYNQSTATKVYEGTTLAVADGEMVITFSTPFEYNGGNLCFNIWAETSAPSVTWKGENPGYASCGYDYYITPPVSNPYGTAQFLPKATFEYEVNAYPKPKNLAVTNLTANGATITWEAPNTDVQSYKYQYREQGGTWSALTSTTDLSAPLTSLTSNTTYEFQVQALYAGDNESVFASTNFTTPCEAFSVDPTAYTYGFEDVADMNCWTLVNGVTYTGAWDNATMQSNFGYEPARTGDNVYMFYYVNYDDTDPEYQTLISPKLTDVPSTGLHVEFYYVGDMNGGGQETFRVGYSTTDNNLSSFTWGNEITNASTAYQRFSANYPAGTKYVAIQHTSDDQYYFFIDDITFEGAAACLEPTAVAANNITTTGAEITWTNGGEETAWDIFVTDDNTVVPDDVTTPTVAGTSTKPYALTSLTHSTTYYVYVRSACSSTEHSAWSTPLTFHTECEGMDLPYSYGFEDGALSVCWNVLNTNTSYNNVTIGDGNANTGTHSLNFFRGSTAGDLVAVLPEVGAYDLSDYQFEFSAKSQYDGYEITVGIMTDPNDLTTFVAQGSVITTTTSYDEYKVRFNEYTGSGKYVAISVVRPSTVTYGYIYIDDIAINPIPSCIEPDGLTVSNEAPHGATFGWTENATATAWQLYISENSTAPADDIVSGTAGLYDANTTPTLTLTTGLNPETLHYVWVRANCGTDGYSMWVGPTTFTTGIACPAPTGLTASNITGHTADLTWTGTSANYNIDYRTAAYMGSSVLEEGFEHSGSTPDGWTHIGNGSITMNTTASRNHTGSYSLRFSGATSDNVVVLPELGVEANTLAISFWSLAESSSSSGSLQIGYVTDATDATSFQQINSYNAADQLSYTHVETVSLASAPAGARVAFRHTSASSSYWWWIDDVVIGTPVAAGAWQEVTSDAENKQLTGLDAETKYEVKVQGDCGTEGLSQWTASTFFTTDVACMAPTTLAAGTPEPNQVELTWTKTGTETAWQICLNGNETSPVDVAASDVTITGTTVAYTLTGLTAETPYTVKVRANCEVSNPGDAQSDWSNEVNFTTAADCPVPVLNDGDITNLSGHTADVAWTGFTQNDSYKVWYRVKEHINGISEDFSANPTGWLFRTGALNTDGTATLSGTSSWSRGTNCGVFDAHMYFNMYSTKNNWLITPSMTINNGDVLNFDLAYTAYSSSATANNAPNTGCTTHRFAVLISTDDMATWTILREWNNSGSTYVLDDVPQTGVNTGNIDLSAYAGETAYIAFFGHSETSSYDNNFHFDNVTIGSIVPAGTLMSKDVEAPATSTTLTGLDPETPYEVYVTGHCATGNVTTVASATQTFTTTVACPAPVLADVDPATITTTTATLTWTGSAASNFTVAYKAANETDFTEVAATPSPFTFAANTLTPATVYTVKVKAVCGGSDGESEWSNEKTFTTECEAVAADGWSENFDDDATGSLPTCWNRINEGTSYNSYPTVSSSNSNSTPNTMYFYTYGSSSSTAIADQYAVLPEMTGLAGMRITLQARGYNTSSTFKVGLMSDPTDATTFVEITNAGNPAMTTGYQEYYFDIPTTATESHVAIMMPKPTSTSSATYAIYIDDISIAPIPSCEKPTALEVTATTTTTATLSWTENGSATAWQICINDDETNPIAAATNPFTVPGLSPSTTYTAKVKAVCNGSDQSDWSTSIQFTTDCDAVSTLPWNVDFEGFTANTVPTCWDNSASTAQEISSYPERIWGVYEYNSNKMIRMYNWYVHTGTALINSPSIVMPTSGAYALTFDYAHNATCGDFIVKVSTDNGATFTNLASYSKGSGSSQNDPGTFTSAEPISLASYAGQTIILQFFANANYGSGAIFVDNIKIEEYHVDKTIEANKWYVISSPVHNSIDGQTLAGVTNLTTDPYDLFGYTESAGTWNAPTVLEQGKGYIYRAAADATLSFVGTPNSGTVNADVTFTTGTGTDVVLQGFNLVGNPYPHEYSYSGDYYSLNTNGTWQATTGGTIGVAEGFLVKVSASGTVDFTESSAKGNTNSTPAIALMVSNEEFEDVAYARLDNGEGLPKIGHLNSEAPMLSIPVDGRRYAIADLGSSCESFDLNFRGYGEYTISLKDNGQMGYIHLIDRATGRDIDLLSQPTYTFTATGNDANRFMVKLTPDAAESAIGSFAYWNGNAWVVEGEGTLQLFDALGRQVFNVELRNSNFEIQNSKFPAAGVYILRLGEKSQKIVVK